MPEAAGWEKGAFNERVPFGRNATVVTGDNIPYSSLRRAAIQAIRNRTATPEQVALIGDTDSVVQEALSLMPKSNT